MLLGYFLENPFNAMVLRCCAVQLYYVVADIDFGKGTPTNKLSNLVGWASRPSNKLGGLEAHPTRISWIFF